MRWFGVDDAKKSLLFLKKHVCLAVSSVFFADAVLIVEGQSEATLLPYYVSAHEGLRNRYVSVLSVGGAHGFVYEKLMDALGIPIAIITDLDIKRVKSGKDEDDGESESYDQVSSLVDRTTTSCGRGWHRTKPSSSPSTGRGCPPKWSESERIC